MSPAVVRDYFGTFADVISGRYLVHRSLPLNLTIVKRQVKSPGRVSCPVKLPVASDLLVRVPT